MHLIFPSFFCSKLGLIDEHEIASMLLFFGQIVPVYVPAASYFIDFRILKALINIFIALVSQRLIEQNQLIRRFYLFHSVLAL